MKYLALLTFALSVVSAAPSPNKKYYSLEACLTDSNVPMIGQSSSVFSKTIEPFNLRVPFTPALLAVPNTVRDVQKAVYCASKFDIKVAARGGGHSYAAMGLGGKDGSFIIDMKKFKSISLDRNNVATVGAGVRLGDLASALYDLGERALPHGLCPGVGIGGHALHGGFGMTSRMWGTTLDTITEMEVVLASGRVVKANKYNNKDLFWALRGAGSSYGIVTSFKLATNPAPKVATYYQFNYHNIDVNTKTDVIMAMQEFGADQAPKELALRLFMNNDTFQVYGVYWGKKSKYTNVIKPLVQLLPTEGRTLTVNGEEKLWLDTLVHLANGAALEQPENYDMHETFFAKSIVTPSDQHLEGSTVRNFFTYLATVGQLAPVNWWVIYDLYGGVGSQIAAPAVASTAYAHRNSLFTIQIYSTAVGQLPPYPQSGIEFVNGISDSIVKAQNDTVFKAYPNYIDPTLSKEEAWNLYYGPQMPKLLKVKNQVDPQRLFWNPQSIGA